MNKQDVYNKVKAHILKQGEPALVDEFHPSYDEWATKCAYKSANGNMCAIGCLFSPDTSSQMFDYVGSVEEILDEFPSLAMELEVDCEEDLKFLVDLQWAHDSVHTVPKKYFKEKFIEKMAMIAKHWKLCP